MGRRGIAPVLVLQFGPQDEGVRAGTEAAEGHVEVVADIVPLIVQPLHLVRVFHVAHLRIVLHGEGDAQGVLLIGGIDAPILIRNQIQDFRVLTSRIVCFADHNLGF